MSRLFPWYDSVWLSQYVSAKAYLSERCPRRLSEFVAAFAPLRTRPDFHVQHLDRVLGDEAISELREIARTVTRDKLELHEVQRFGRFVVHDSRIPKRLQESATSLVGNRVGEPVELSYTFLSLYTKLGRCPVHMDAPNAKWTLDICIDQSEPWPIHFSQVMPWPEAFGYHGEDWSDHIKVDPTHVFTSHVLEPGDALLFSGSAQWHYREALPRTGNEAFCHLLFFHFIPQGMQEIVEPKNWAKIFDVPALTQVVQQHEE